MRPVKTISFIASPAPKPGQWLWFCRITTFVLLTIWYWLGAGFLADLHSHMHRMQQANAPCCTTPSSSTPWNRQPPKSCDPQTCAFGAFLHAPAILWTAPCMLAGASLRPATLIPPSRPLVSLASWHADCCRGPPSLR